MDSPDLTDLLRSWPLEPGKINARLITGDDDSPRLQVRVDLGILQMHLDGRPDGQQPGGAPSLLDLQRRRMQRYAEHSGLPVGFALSAEQCRDLRQEAVQYYHRYVALFALGEYEYVVLDTEHNLAILDMCRDHAAEPGDRTILEQFRPQIVTMRARAQAEHVIAERQPKQALAVLDRGLDELRAIYAELGNPDQFDSSNEAMLLRGMRDALVPKLPASQRVELEERLRAAIDAENYELAAILRDELRMMK